MILRPLLPLDNWSGAKAQERSPKHTCTHRHALSRQKRGNRSLTDPLFQVCSLTWGGSGQDTRVSEAGLQQAADDKEEQDGCNDGDGQGQVSGKEGAAVEKTENRSCIVMNHQYRSGPQLSWGSELKHCCFGETSGTARAIPESPSGAGKTGSSQYKPLHTTSLPFTSPRIKNLTQSLATFYTSSTKNTWRTPPQAKHGSKSA